MMQVTIRPYATVIHQSKEYGLRHREHSLVDLFDLCGKFWCPSGQGAIVDARLWSPHDSLSYLSKLLHSCNSLGVCFDKEVSELRPLARDSNSTQPIDAIV